MRAEGAGDRLRLIEAAMDQASEGVVISDARPLGPDTPQIIYANAQFERLTGYSREEAVGRSPLILQHEETSPEALERLRRAYLACRPVTVELAIGRRDGTPCYVELSATPLDDGHGTVTHWVSVQRDATERRRAQAALVERSRVEAVSRLAAGVAHDFNNLLTVIASSAELARWDLPEEHPATARLQDIETAAQRARMHTGQLLAVIQRDHGAPEPIDVRATVKAALAGLRRLAGPGLAVRAALPSRAVMCRIDGEQLTQLLGSLVANARDAQPAGGEVRIAVAVPVGTGRLLLTVEDDGPGLPEADAARAFEPFWSSKPMGTGAGLGLPTVRWIAARSGGTARMERAASGGARVVVELPTCDLSAPAAAGDARPPENLPR